MRVVYLFVSKGSAPYNSCPPWNPNCECAPIHTSPDGLPTEGTFYILDKLQAKGVIDELFIVYESSRGPGKATFGRHKGIVVPELGSLTPYIKKGDVLFVRGGWRGWWEWLNERQGKHWLINYSANTGRQRWKFWDIILWDLQDICKIDRLERLWLTFRKPTHPAIFKDTDDKQIYDICVGASFIHDKKGQWRIIHILEQIQKLYGYTPKCIMPGAMRHSTQTNWLINHYERYGIEAPGMLERNHLAKIFNQSKIAVFLGTGGQGDRGPLEAMQCGCNLVIGAPQYHSPPVYKNTSITYVPPNIDDYEMIAKNIHAMLQTWRPENRQEVLKWNREKAHADYVTYYDLARMFDMIRKNPIPNAEAMRKEYGC